MKLTLRLAAPSGAAPAGMATDTRVLETGTLTIGRGVDNDWTLEDPDRVLSKVHCRIDSSGDGYLLTDVSTNGVFVNGAPQPIGRGHAYALTDGDSVGIGSFTITAAIEHDDRAGLAFGDAALPAAAPGKQPIAYSGVVQDPDSPIARPAEEPWLHAIPGGDFGPGLRAAPIGWDAPPDPAEYAASGQRATDMTLAPPATEFGQNSEHLPAISGLLRLPTKQVVLPTDWMDTDPLHNLELAPSNIAPSLATASLTATVLPDPEPAPGPAPAWPSAAIPAPAPETPVPEAPAAVAPAAAITGAQDAFLAGFLEGAGLPMATLDAGDLHGAGHNIGQMLRTAIEGVRDILATRAMVKSELRVDQTIVQAAANNPMKFAPDVQRCLAAMAGTPPGAFLPGAAAMRQALDDIKVHELALIAALNSVFGELSTLLDPEAIADKVRGEAGIGSMVPVARSAKCWALYEKNYRTLQESGAQNTGGSLLSPLAAAYARQVRRT